MNGGRHPRKTSRALWRWRRNPLRRRDDATEAWIVLAVWIAVVVGGTITGVLTARSAEGVFTAQRADRRPVSAVLVSDVPRTATGVGGTYDRTSAKVRWTSPEGAIREGSTLVETGQRAGTEVKVWTDGRGGLSTEPPTPAEAAVEAGVLGVAAGLALSGLVFGIGGAGRWWLDRRRVALWGTEWARIGPLWSQKTG
ncbi:hypothetical protein [Streptomyces sp. 11x1]|uniref:Rv1733c family protein n=1 Tax=Streptomyces sp. 11x1 TaxID=3038642 RepID=UPI002931CA88|nr:hypothetical protein [Streptomyces sp. 11x1]WNZ06669.1 hypothetical protein P8T65_03045 [Streptomyces sp. 11x1]